MSNIDISGRHLELTDALRTHVQERLERALAHLGPTAPKCSVVLSAERHNHHAEIKIHAERHELFAKHSAEDLYAAIDGAASKLSRQIDDLKGKKSNRSPSPRG